MRRHPPRARRCRPALEPLEHRLAPATLPAGFAETVVAGGGAPLANATRIGYQLTVGQECIRSRVASGGAFGFRFVRMPEHPAFADALDVTLTLSLTLRIRL